HDSDFLLVDDQVLLTESTQQRYFKLATRANNLESLEYASRIEAYFIPDYQTLTWHSIDILRDGKRIHKLSADDIRMIQTEDELDNEMIIGRVTSLVFVPDTRVGDIIEYSYTVEGSNPVFDNRFFTHLMLSWESPVQQRHIRVVAPESNRLMSKIVKNKAALTEQITEFGREYVLELRDVPGVKFEDDYPANFEPQGYVEFSDYPTWADVSSWAEPLYSSQPFQHAELRTLVDRLKTLSIDDALQEALYFAQNRVRYVGIELGINTHAPRTPDKVLADGYGDCKDKTLLLVSILDKIGIKAYPALVSSRNHDAFLHGVPSPRHFDHVITLIELPEKQIWVDPTMRFQKGRIDTIGYQNYGAAMPIGHPGKKPIVMEFSDSQLPEYDVEEDFRILIYGGPTILEIRNRFSAAQADRVRRMIMTTGLQGLQDRYLDFVNEQHPSARVFAPIQVEDDEHVDQITVTETYLLSEFTGKSEMLNSWRYETSMFALSGYVRAPNPVTRSWPWALPGKRRLRHRTTIHHPLPVNFEQGGADLVLEHPAFKFKAVERSLQKQLVNDVTLEFTGLKAILPEQVEGYAKMMEQINRRGFISYTIQNESPSGLINAMQKLAKSIKPYSRPGMMQ
ncbi:MAG: DUF3857 domain-containing protein, partial [Pseudomonadales bacterium]|nr:DUF3857 domain-containing protein [Pseudomonadales bacterium]